MEETRKHPVGMQAFDKVGEGGYVCDKTKCIVDFLEITTYK